MRLPLLLFLALLVTGCTNMLAKRQAFLNQFVGHPDSELVQQLGVPNRTYETDGVKYLAYDERKLDVIPAMPPYGPGPWRAYGSYGGTFPPQVIALTCETTFAVSNGMVTSYTLRGNACG